MMRICALAVLAGFTVCKGQYWELTEGTATLTQDISVIDSMTGWGIGSFGTLLKTTDAAESWQQFVISDTLPALNSISFCDHSNGWAAGDAGVIVRTADGGINWVRQPCGTTDRFEDISFCDPSHGWALTRTGTVFKTINGGAFWSLSSSDSVSRLFGISFADSLHGWMVGARGTIRKTVNGGASWGIQASGRFDYLTDVCFIDTMRGWASALNGIVLQTLNGGITWSVLNFNPEWNFYGVSFLSKDYGWVVGSQYNLLRYIDPQLPGVPYGLTIQYQNNFIYLRWRRDPLNDYYQIISDYGTGMFGNTVGTTTDTVFVTMLHPFMPKTSYQVLGVNNP